VIEADVIKGYRGWLNIEQAGSRPLITDCDVAEPDCLMTVIKQGTRDYPYWVGEIQDPGTFGCEPGNSFRDLQDHRNGTQRLGESTGACGLLANTATLQGKGLI
jgi:hypothetical protein